MAVTGRAPAGPMLSRPWLRVLHRGPWPVVVAAVSVVSLVLLRPDRGDVAIYRHGARAAVTTGAVYAFQQRGHGFTYPPFAALTMASVAWLPNWAMWAVLVLVGVASLGVVLALSAPGIAAAVRSRSAGAAPGLAVLIVSEPVVTTLRFGQIDLLLAAAVLTDVLVLRRGVLLGLAIAMKLTPAIFVLYLVVRGRYREAGTASAVFLASALWGFLVLPRASITYWTHNAVAGTGVGSFTTVGNQSVHGVVARVLGTQVGTAVWIVAAGPMLVLGLGLARRCARAGHELLAVATVGVVACLVSPVSWPHHWVWFVALLCGLWRLPARDARLTRWVVASAGFAVISQFVPLKAVGIGYVPIAVALLVLERARLGGGAFGQCSPARHRTSVAGATTRA